MRIWLTTALLALAAQATTAVAEESKVHVRLFLSGGEFDPAKLSNATLKCVVQNGSGEAIQVPVGYDTGSAVLRSGTLTLHRRRPAEGDVKLVRVGPGKEQVVFELKLDDLLLGGTGPQVAWRWDWPRRPEPPRSPIHKYRQPGFLKAASFTARITVGGKALTSDMAVLKVKTGDQ